MKPSRNLEALLAAGERNGWDYSARTMALGLIQNECSANTAWAIRKGQVFLPEESLLPSENVKSLRAVLALDAGPSKSQIDGAATFSSEGGLVTSFKPAPKHSAVTTSAPRPSDFASLVASLVSNGKTKAAALREAIHQSPQLYQSWLNSDPSAL